MNRYSVLIDNANDVNKQATPIDIIDMRENQLGAYYQLTLYLIFLH